MWQRALKHQSFSHLTLPDIAELPIGHRRLLINEVNKIQSPLSKALLTAIDSQELQTAGTESLWLKQLFPHDHSDSSGTLDTVVWKKLIRGLKSINIQVPWINI